MQSYSECISCDGGESGGGGYDRGRRQESREGVEYKKKCKTRDPYKKNTHTTNRKHIENQSSSKSSMGSGKNGNIKGTDAPERPRKRCCPYSFDSSRCRVVDDRILCGYDSNIGGPIAFNDRIRRLSKGCRLRGKRIECGYEHAPYTNIRRPPAHKPKHPEEKQQEISPSDDFDDKPVVLKGRTKFYTTRFTLEWDNAWDLRKDNIKCVEIRGRIVCKDK